MPVDISFLKTNIPDALFYDIQCATIRLRLDQFSRYELEAYYFFTSQFLAIFDDANYEGVVYAEPIHPKRAYLHECSLSKNHRTHWWTDKIDHVIIHGDGELTPFVLNYENMFPIVSIQFGESLRKAKLKGLELRRIRSDQTNSSRKIGEDVYLLIGRESLPTAPWLLDPDLQNVCPFCKKSGPVFCPECGFVTPFCPACGKHVIADSFVHEGDDKDNALRFDMDTCFPPELNKAAGAIDMARVDRELDYSGDGQFSRRALEFLIQEEAFPLAIRPSPVRFEDGRVGYTRERTAESLDELAGMKIE